MCICLHYSVKQDTNWFLKWLNEDTDLSNYNEHKVVCLLTHFQLSNIFLLMAYQITCARNCDEILVLCNVT